jgi:hypothetical protein
MNVAQFATELGLPETLLLERLRAAGVDKTAPKDLLTEQDKMQFLDYLRRVHGTKEQENKIILNHPETQKIKESNSTDWGSTIQEELVIKTGNREESPADEMKKNSTLLYTLQKICEASGNSDKSKEWLVMSYKDDFGCLWHGRYLWDWLRKDGQRNILLIWEGMPEPNDNGVNVLDHITPVDWAIALSHRLLQNEKIDESKTVPELRILICDISQQNHANAFAVRMLPAICHGMPWLRVYRPIESDKWFGRNFEVLVNDINQFDPKTYPSLMKARTDLVETLVHAWIGSVAESSSHHDVSNLLGTLVLSTGLITSELSDDLLNGNPARCALLEKMKWLNMVPGEVKNKQDCWFDFAQYAAKIAHEKERVKIILIDDQANQGWLDIVIAAVGAQRVNTNLASINQIEHFAESSVVDVFASTSYDAIGERIKAANTDQKFKFSLTGDGAEILLLDLRLFFNWQDEIRYFEWTLGIVTILKSANKQAFPDIDCDKLKKWIDKAKANKSAKWRRDTEYLELLTLLPRILATIDMSLPIVIFSSTGQRQVTEAFKSYGNIITVFEKPKFFGYAMENITQETVNKFQVAMKKALGLVRARSAVQRIQQAAASQDERAMSDEGVEADQYVEVFIDESGTVNNGLFVVSGIALVHRNKEEAVKLDCYMKDHSFELNGVSYKLRWNGENKLPKHFAESNPPGEAKELKKLLPIFEAAIRQFSTKFFTFSLSEHITDMGAFDPLNNTNLDNVYLRLVREVVDALAYEFLPSHIHGSFALKVCAATRQRVKGNVGNQRIAFSKQESNDLRMNYGINVELNGTYSSMQPISLVPIMADIAASRPHSNPSRPKLTGAIAVQLNYEDRLSKRSMGGYPIFYRNVHHLADIVAYFSRVSQKNPDLDILREFGNDRMVDDYTESGFPEAIYAGKCLDAGDLSEALLFAYAAIEKNPTRQFENSITGKVCLRINNALGNMMPDQFMAFATGLGDSRKIMRMKRPSGAQEGSTVTAESGVSLQIRLAGLTITDTQDVLGEACMRLRNILGGGLDYHTELTKSKNTRKPVIMLEFDNSDTKSRVWMALGACKDGNRFWRDMLEGVL